MTKTKEKEIQKRKDREQEKRESMFSCNTYRIKEQSGNYKRKISRYIKYIFIIMYEIRIKTELRKDKQKREQKYYKYRRALQISETFFKLCIALLFFFFNRGQNEDRLVARTHWLNCLN